jgi:hypothetical protein
MKMPQCVDGTMEHTWVTQSATGITLVSQCMVCGVKEIIRWQGDVETVRYGRRPRWGFAGLPPDDERPRAPAMTEVSAIPQTAKEQARDALLERFRRGR